MASRARHFVGRGAALGVLGFLLVAGSGAETGLAAGINAGDTVKVSTGAAPVKVGTQTLTTLGAGIELKALKVQGDWVQVTVEKDGMAITGWIHKKNLVPAGAGGTTADRPFTNSIGMQFVLIPAGTFTMGSTEEEIKAMLAKWPEADKALFSDETPAHTVTISKAFWMCKHEVTVGQFRRFVEAKGYKTDAEKGTGFKPQLASLIEQASGQFGRFGEPFWGAVLVREGKLTLAQDASWRKPYVTQTDEHPVVCVSWKDARAFAEWLNTTDKARPIGSDYRLPTEAEWEYACRAGTTTWYQWGDDPDKGKGWCNGADLTAKKAFPDTPNRGWFHWDDGFPCTAPVGSFKGNAFGLRDMHGNVSEWCQDWYGPYKEGNQTDPTGASGGQERVQRGGAWPALPWCLRSAHRARTHPEDRGNHEGFRLVLAAGPQ